MRFCPRCQTERGLEELICRGSVDSQECGWNLSFEPIRPRGWRPQRSEATTASVPDDTLCPNGHPVGSGDLLCPVCEAEVGPGTDAAPVESDPTEAQIPPLINGWQLGSRLNSATHAYDRFNVVRTDDGRRAVLTLYAPGNEPDTAVYDVLRALPLDHAPEIVAVGRWQDRAYEVSEEFTAGTLAELAIDTDDAATLIRVVDELGRALHSLSERGVRHRDLRPGTVLVRTRDPLDLVITGYGSARLSEFDLDIVAPLETSCYTAPEAIIGGVAAASDWWSLGMIVLELLTGGSCFNGVNPQAFLIHVMTNGIEIREGIDPRFEILLRGLLARNHRERWRWDEVKRWLDGENPAVPAVSTAAQETVSAGPTIRLAGRAYGSATSLALAAADASTWAEARDLFLRGAVATWAAEAGLNPQIEARLRHLAGLEDLSDDFRFALALKALNPAIPLTCRGDIVTPGWLLDHPDEGYDLITGPIPDILRRMDTEAWLVRLNQRAASVRERANQLEVSLNEEELRIHLLATSRSRLAAMWEVRRRVLPDTDHPALEAVLERRSISEEDLILLLSANVSQFRAIEAIVAEAARLAERAGVTLPFDALAAGEWLVKPRRDLYAAIDKRIEGFARCGVSRVDDWVDQFRLEGRLPLARALVILSVPSHAWSEPPKQAYVATLLDFFARRVANTVQRGPLTRMTIGKTTRRLDITELASDRATAAALLDRMLLRCDEMLPIDRLVFQENPTLERRARALHSQASLYRRDTGIDGLYLGFPFLLVRSGDSNTRPRIAPVLLWPARLRPEVGARGRMSIGFDRDRDEVRLNPALEAFLGSERFRLWPDAVDELLTRSTVKAADVMDALGVLGPPGERNLVPLPGRGVRVSSGQLQLRCSAVLFHMTYVGHAIVEELRQLKGCPPTGTALETALRVAAPPQPRELPRVHAVDRFFTAASDPSQEAAVLAARTAPGLVVQGPPGTGKSQTIVNMVADAIGCGRNLLVVCQKQAALEVVRKRLDAEGLSDRIVMITDTNKDREPTIRAIREQVESLQSAWTSEAAAWHNKRQQTAARIESLEAELDQHHAALYKIDQATSLTYRSLLGELVCLESSVAALIDAPALRPLLADFNPATVASLEETCGPLAVHWLPSRFEDSPLHDLKVFGADAGTLSLFKTTFDEFVASEQTRLAVVANTPEALRVDKPDACRTWLDRHAETFRQLQPEQRADLARWLSLFPVAGEPAGEQLIGELDAVGRGLADFATPVEADSKLRFAVVGLDTTELRRWLDLAQELATPPSFVSRLFLIRWRKSRRLTRFINEHTSSLPADDVATFRTLLEQEIALRPWRTRLGEVLKTLQIGPQALQSLGPSELSDLTDQIQLRLERTRDLTLRLPSCPDVALVESAVRQATPQAFDRFVVSSEQGLERHAARDGAIAALSQLESWMTEWWYSARRAAIDSDATNASSLDTIRQALPTLQAFQRFRIRAAHLDPTATNVFKVLRRAEAALAQYPEADLDAVVRLTIAREARLAWKSRLETENPALLLEASELEARIRALAVADEQMRTINRNYLVHGIDLMRLASRREWQDVTRLRGPRMRRLREFIEMGAELGLMALRPVWLMNPDVASRILPLRPGLFDTVIYDEASQMPLEHALPTLYRGKVMVISGDEKQMPPTSFFASRIENDEADVIDVDDLDDQPTGAAPDGLSEAWNRRDIKDCPDLLQLAGTVLPTETLQVHYRSAYQELISFSNASFYGNQLNVPVRYPDDEVLRAKPIQMIRVDGVYQEQTNEAEAEAVVRVLEKLWKVPGKQRQSVGVVTFNRKQADLIEEVLEARAESDARFRQALEQERERIDGGEDMGFFVKNVENVQGDERDIIIFSSTFGRNAQGTFRRAFGVLGQTGGERRLNVAVTRARNKIILVTSMPIEEVSDMLSTRQRPSAPRDYLQAYLEYARVVSAGELDTSRALLSRLGVDRQSTRRQPGHELDGFQRAVAEFVQQLGCEPAADADGGAFAVDLAIKHPRTGQYVVGIECDAPRHPLLVNARAREMWRPAMLKRVIPHMHRVSSYGWYHNREQEQERLKRVIEQALN